MEIQVLASGVAAGDQSMLLKYILHRIGEKYGYSISFVAKPRFTRKENINGSGCHVNFSTEAMRSDPSTVDAFISKLAKNHEETMILYGDDNKLRLTGKNETSEYEKFTYGIGNRSASVRIPKTYKYIEDRRPSSSANMYTVTSHLMELYLK